MGIKAITKGLISCWLALGGVSLRCSWIDLVQKKFMIVLFNDFCLKTYSLAFAASSSLRFASSIAACCSRSACPVEISPNQNSLAKSTSEYQKASKNADEHNPARVDSELQYPTNWWLFPPTGWWNLIHQQGLHLGRAFSASSILRSSSCRRLSCSILTVFL